MRAVIQRVRRAAVTVIEEDAGEPATGVISIPDARPRAIAAGVVVLLGVAKEDTPAAAAYLAEKTAQLRIFPDAQGKMNVSLLESGHAALVVSQFTLYGDHSSAKPHNRQC